MKLEDLKKLPPPPFKKFARQVGEPKILPYDIIEVMEDPEYMKHFMRRFQMACEQVAGAGKLIGAKCWYWTYKDDPMLLYHDALDNIKTMLGRQSSSAAILPVGRTLRHIVLKAASDWICEKEGRIPEREIFINTVHTLPIPYEKYYVNKEEPKPKD